MVDLTLDGINNRSDFSEDVIAYKLSELQDKKLVPTGEVLHPFVSFMLLYNAVKNFLMKKTDELTEYVFARIHVCPIIVRAANMENQFKSTLGFSCCI